MTVPMTQDDGTQKARVRAILAPRGFSDILLASLRQILAPLAEYFDEVLLVRAEYEAGHSGFLIAVVGADVRTHQILTETIFEALGDGRYRSDPIDVTHIPADEPTLDRLRKLAVALSRGAEPGKAVKPTGVFISSRGRGG